MFDARNLTFIAFFSIHRRSAQQFSRTNEVLAGLGFHEKNPSSFSKLSNVKVENTSFYALYLKKQIYLVQKSKNTKEAIKMDATM